MSKTIIIDPGHGGTQDLQGSDANHAISFSGVKEKIMTLDLAKRTQASLSRKSPETKVVLTREADINVAGADRASLAKQHGAELFLSIHFNGFDKHVRGVETFVRDKGNINLGADKAYAQRIQSAVLGAIRKHQPNAPDRKVKLDSDVGFSMAVLSDISLGNLADPQPCLACLAEIEFIDNPDVDRLLNGPGNESVRDDIADALAAALLEQIGVTPSSANLNATPTPLVLTPTPGAGAIVPGPDQAQLRSGLFSGNSALEAVADGHLELTNSSQRREEVGLVQDALNRLADLGGNYRVDLGSARQFRGFYGPKTRDAVLRFENDFRLTTNGSVDAETLLALDDALVRQSQGLNPLPLVSGGPGGNGLTPSGYQPPPSSASLLHGVDFSKADPSIGLKFRQAYAAADNNPNLAKGDPSNCKALLAFPKAVFFEAKMAICADGSPRAISIDPPFGQTKTAFTFPGTSDSFNAESVPYIVLPGKASGRDFAGDFKIGKLDLGVVIANGQVTPAFYGEVGPAFRLGEASIQMHENLPVKFPWMTTAKTRIRNASVPKEILYLIFPGTAMARKQGMSAQEWLDATLEAASKKFEEFVESGGTK